MIVSVAPTWGDLIILPFFIPVLYLSGFKLLVSLVDTLSVSLDRLLGLLTPPSSLGSSAISSFTVVLSDVALVNTSFSFLPDTFHLANTSFACSKDWSNFLKVNSLALLVSSFDSFLAGGAARTCGCNYPSKSFMYLSLCCPVSLRVDINSNRVSQSHLRLLLLRSPVSSFVRSRILGCDSVFIQPSKPLNSLSIRVDRSSHIFLFCARSSLVRGCVTDIVTAPNLSNLCLNLTTNCDAMRQTCLFLPVYTLCCVPLYSSNQFCVLCCTLVCWVFVSKVCVGNLLCVLCCKLVPDSVCVVDTMCQPETSLLYALYTGV